MNFNYSSWFVRDTQRRQAGFLSMMESSIDLLGPAYGDTICDIIEYVISTRSPFSTILYIYLIL
jgi:hypothetical protein